MIHQMEELSTTQLDGLDRAKSVVILTVSPLEEHGPHLPLGVDSFTAQHFAQTLALRITDDRPGWQVVLAPPLYLGSFTFDRVGSVKVRQRVVRDLLVDYGSALARAGFRYILISNGHGGPGHLVALEEAAQRVSRKYGVSMASFTGHLSWKFLRGKYVEKIEAALGRQLTPAERQAFNEDAHGGWWETSMMLLLRPELVDPGYKDLPAARYSLPERLRPNYPVRGGRPGYVGHPALADAGFARATAQVLVDHAMELVRGLLDGTLGPSARRSPFYAIPFFRTNFWPAVAALGVMAAVLALYWALR
jgi:creatinine amidohydrolase